MIGTLHPNSKVSLIDMLRFHAQPFVKALGYMSAIEENLFRQEEGYFANDEQWQHFSEWMDRLDQNCEQLDLPLSRRHIERIRENIDKGDPAGLKHTIYELRYRVYDELDTRLLLAFDGNKAALFDAELHFGQEVADKFPSTAFDIEEAGKCLALQRSTACAFHLFRVAEVGLITLAGALGIPDTLPSWDSILKKIDSELRKDYKDKEPVWKKDEDFYADAAAHLRNYKNARNNTQHADKKYTLDESERIFNAVKLLIQHLATKLTEPPPAPISFTAVATGPHSIRLTWEDPEAAEKEME